MLSTFLTFATMMSVKQYLAAVLSYTSINTTDIGNTVFRLLVIWASSSVSCLTISVSLTYFSDLWSWFLLYSYLIFWYYRVEEVFWFFSSLFLWLFQFVCIFFPWTGFSFNVKVLSIYSFVVSASLLKKPFSTLGLHSILKISKFLFNVKSLIYLEFCILCDIGI